MSHQCCKRKVGDENDRIIAFSFDGILTGQNNLGHFIMLSQKQDRMSHQCCKWKVVDENERIMAVSFDRIFMGQKKNLDILSCFHKSRIECPMNAENESKQLKW